jgi:hypothetical protein
MKTTKSYVKAGIHNHSGVLVINSLYNSIANKFVDVNVEIDHSTNTIQVKAYKHETGISLHSGSFDVNDITDSSIEEYRPWPWSSLKKRSKHIVEFKKKDPITFTSNHYTIIE